MKNLPKYCSQPKPVLSVSDMLPFASVQGIFSLKMQYLGMEPPLEDKHEEYMTHVLMRLKIQQGRQIEIK